MTTTTTIANTITAPAAKTPLAPPPAPARFRFPEPPEREIDESMTNYRQMTYTGQCHHLVQYLGNRDTTLVTADFWVARGPRPGTAGLRRPDLLVAFDVDPEAYFATGGYLITEQGKPPDFVLEVASKSTAKVDVEEKPGDYAALGIPEYWRFDETGDFHGDRLAGDRLVNGRYEPIPIAELPDGSLQGYSAVLNLHLRAEQGWLGWYDPSTGRHIATFDHERAGRLQAESRAERAEARAEQEQAARLQEQAARLQEQAARLQEQAARLQAEAQVRELQERLRLRGGG